MLRFRRTREGDAGEITTHPGPETVAANGQANIDIAPAGLAIEVSGLSKAFGRTPVLRRLDLSVPWGQVLTVLGPNGCGKTTLIKILATLMRPDAGVARVAGLDLARAGQSARRMIGVVTHDTLLYDNLTGYENLRFYSQMFGLDEVDDRIEAVAARMGLTARLHQRVSTLSHGLRKRFSIARALLHDPPILLMDEPETGLDQEALAFLDDVISGPSEPYRTVVMTTHNLERGLALGDRLAILSNGGIGHLESVDAAGAAALRNTYLRYTGAPR